jgi:hypothetical protein
VLAFVLARQGGHVFGIERGGVRHWRLPGWVTQQPVLAELRRQLAAPLGADDAERLRPRLQTAAASVLPDGVREFVARQRVVFVVDHGLLQSLPLELLAWDDRRLVGEVVACTTVDSLPVAMRLVERLAERPPMAGALLVGTLAPTPTPTPSTAPPAERVPVALAAALRQLPGDLHALLDENVTAAAIAQVPWDRAVVQIVAHGVAAAGGVGRTLALGAAGEFGPARIAGLRCSGLVIVSSCGAARAPRRLGDETFHGSLGGAFLLAGAHTVVQSAADMMLAAHVELLRAAHEGLLAGEPAAVAFCRARRARAAEDDFAARLEHAQMRVFGVGIEPINRR